MGGCNTVFRFELNLGFPVTGTGAQKTCRTTYYQPGFKNKENSGYAQSKAALVAASILHAKRPALSQQPNVYLEPKWLRYLSM
jgi:hypothetical protein